MGDKRSDRGDLKRELNALWRSTIDQFDELKNVIVESSVAGRAKIDATMLKRERERKLAEIGEAMLALFEAGKLELPDELEGTVERIRHIEREIEEQESEFRRVFTKERPKGGAGAASEPGHAEDEEAGEGEPGEPSAHRPPDA